MTQNEHAALSPIVVTGANGFVGSRIVRRLAETGKQVRAIIRAKALAPELSGPSIDSRIQKIEGDFTLSDVADRAARGAGAVIHCAATVGPDMETARRVNVEGTRTMVEAALAARVRRYVQISTLSVYVRGDRERIDEESPLLEDGQPYGLTKAEADRVVRDAMGRGLPAVILRPGAILGMHPTSSWAVRVPSRIRDGQMKLRGDGRELMPWVHVENLVDAVLLTLENDRAVGRVYNIADREVSWRDHTDQVRGWFGLPPLESIPPEEFGGYEMGHIDASRIRSELGYRPRHSYEEGMSEAAEHWASERTAHS
jgi:nucleoside-diphosphate-sugar epimerase